jgi:ferrous iron transport protein A
MKIPLTKLKRGTKAKIVEVAAGKQAAHRLSTMGLRVGVHIARISTFVLRGPVTVKVGSTTIALGHGMAEKIIVESHP